MVQSDRSTWTSLLLVMDGAMIDLKCLDPEIHRAITGQPNDQVLDSIRYLKSIDRLYEVRLLLMPGINDDPMLLDDTARLAGRGRSDDARQAHRLPQARSATDHVRTRGTHARRDAIAYESIFARHGQFNLCVI